MLRKDEPIRIVLLVIPGPDSGSVFGPLDILRYASQFATEQGVSKQPSYEIEVVSAGNDLSLCSIAGLRMMADRTYCDVKGPIDTLLITPIDDDQLSTDHPELVEWLSEVAPEARRVVGLCTGTYLVAQTGLLNGRRVTTHWAYADEFAKRFPKIDVDPDPIYVKDGNFYTSAGAMAGMDLVLALVEEDLGPEIARMVARFFVIYLKRPGSQSQFSAQLSSQFAHREPIRDLQGWIFDHLDADLSVDTLADRTGMSPRNFRRVFSREVGQTPAKFVEQARLEAARRKLEETTDGIEGIAAANGFGSAEQMRLTFMRTLGIPPAAYRERFATSLRVARARD